jgi:membrane-associated protease RseP (regulator of RpoE activity)
MIYRCIVRAYLCIFAFVFTSCATKTIPTQPPESPQEYLSNALDWIETNDVKIDTVDWATVREQALALAPNPKTTSDTYPAIKFALTQLGDTTTVFFRPEDLSEKLIDPGFDAYYPEAVILSVYPGRPAAKAGLRVGDVIVAVDGKPPVPYLGTEYVVRLQSAAESSKLKI